MVSSFQKLAFLSEEKGFQVLLVMTPDIHNLKDYPFNFIHSKIKKLAEQNNFYFVDLLPSFINKTAKEFWAMPGDPHPNALGHSLMAKSIYPALRDILQGKS